MITKSTAVFAVSDLPKSVAFYRDVLGFKQQWLWDDPPTFGCIGLGSVEVFLSEDRELNGRTEGLMHCFYVEDIEALYALHKSRNANILSALQNQPWGLREYTVRDLDGYHLRFGGPAKHERPPTGTDTLPQYIQVAKGVPTSEQYIDLFHSVGWPVHRESITAALKNTFLGFMATDTRNGQIVGMARVFGDGSYFMLWDVIVRPSHQGQKIGTALVEAALEALRERAHPGAFLGLFTSRYGFYERMGFKPGGGMQLAL
jgi:GNAT superfamily N-acetyltransferase/uncharacterized glyoxalase superfamily protein PhnB